MASNPPSRCRTCAMYYDANNFCAHLGDEELQVLNANSQVASLARGECIPEDVVRRWPLLAVAKGELSLQYILHDGRRTIASFFSRGDILELRGANNQRFGSLIALSHVEFCKLSPEMFEQIMTDNPNARTLVWSNMQAQVFRAHNHAVDLAKKKTLEKLASFILECSNRYPDRAVPEFVRIPMRRRDLAEYLGMQPETISRCFKGLENREIIAVSDTSVIRICNRPALRLIANGAGNGEETEGFKILRVGA